MPKKINWGIIGLGSIANTFARDLVRSDKAKLYGVASRDPEKAQKFGKKYKSVKNYGSYEKLAKDPEIDVVYIATPHTLHFENTMMCLQEGKAVLCEKPMGINSKEVETMIEEARSRNVFLMEAIWTRFIPGTEKVLELIRNNQIGDIISIRADFGFKADTNPESRLYNKKLGGGSLLDIGIYPLYLSLLLLGTPVQVKAVARMTKTKVDSYCAMLLDYANGAKAVLESTVEARTPTEAFIYGTKGTVKMHFPFHHTKRISLFQNNKQASKVYHVKYKGNGYYNEIEEVNNCLISGKTESDKLPPSVSMDLIRMIDRVKQEIGLRYDTER
ncbi:MAG: Gfo/Idh/MocA family oxidoreductase [Chlorobi bacterium]|nr:Gfo/Idh/MocA family oxidoreductase [Chlorobiota bacterium]